MLKVFVYGTLKPGESNYPHYCEGRVIEVVPAYTFACLYNLPVGYPAMTPGNQKIEGFLLTFADENHLYFLDELEGCINGQPIDNSGYYRQQVDIYHPSEEYLARAWAYFMTAEQVKLLGGQLEVSGCWRPK